MDRLSIVTLEFHYYIVYFIALRAGFEDDQAHLLAYSSQFVDHNIISFKIDTGNDIVELRPTQNYGFWDDSFAREVYVPFHFFPGDPDYAGARRTDGKKNPLNTTPGSDRVKQLLIDALKTRNLYRVGIALHTYADSWAHQNFSGFREDWNTIDPSSVVPSIGHAQALKNPDRTLGRWEDPRLVPENKDIDNYKRVIRAARQIYKYLATYNRRSFDDVEMIEWELEELLDAKSRAKEPQERINDLIIRETMTPYNRSEWLRQAADIRGDPGDERMFRGYDKVLWFRDAVVYRNKLAEQRSVGARPGFADSHLMRWHRAADEHRAAARRILRDLVPSFA